VRQWQELFYEHRYSGVDLGPSNPDFVALAESCGVKGLRMEKKDEVVSVIKQALAHEGPVVIHCVCAKQDNVYPMVPTGQALDSVLDMA